MLSGAAGSSLPVTQQIAPSCSDSPDKGGMGRKYCLIKQWREERREPGVLKGHFSLNFLPFFFFFVCFFHLEFLFISLHQFSCFFSLNHSISISVTVSLLPYPSISLFALFRRWGIYHLYTWRFEGSCNGLIDGLFTDVQPPQETQTTQLFSS